MTYLFVYGTLMSSHNNQMARFLRAHATLIGKGKIPGKIFDLGDYPGAIFDPQTTSIVNGEIYHLNNPKLVLARVDEYEGIGPEFPHPHEYIRIECPVFYQSEIVKCWMYAYNL